MPYLNSMCKSYKGSEFHWFNVRWASFSKRQNQIGGNKTNLISIVNASLSHLFRHIEKASLPSELEPIDKHPQGVGKKSLKQVNHHNTQMLEKVKVREICLHSSSRGFILWTSAITSSHESHVTKEYFTFAITCILCFCCFFSPFAKSFWHSREVLVPMNEALIGGLTKVRLHSLSQLVRKGLWCTWEISEGDTKFLYAMK